MISISWQNVTLLEAAYILSNNSGYIDGDKKTIELEGKND